MFTGKNLTLLFLLAGFGLANQVVVLENLQDFNKFLSAQQPISPMRSKLVSGDDGVHLAPNPFRKLDGCVNECKCFCSCGDESGNSSGSGGSDDSDDSEKNPKFPNVGEYVSNLSDIREGSVYCLSVLSSGQVVKGHPDHIMRQQNSNDCAQGSGFKFTHIENRKDHLAVHIVNSVTGLTLKPRNLNSATDVILETTYNASDNTQTWLVIKNNYSTDSQSWFFIKNSTKNNVFNIRSGQSGLRDVIAYPFTGSRNEAFRFKVLSNP